MKPSKEETHTTFRYAVFATIVILLALIPLCAPCHAQISTGGGSNGGVTITMTLPVTGDPYEVHFTTPGQLITQASDGTALTGGILCTNFGPDASNNGLFVYGDVPATAGTPNPIVEIDLYTTYNGKLSLLSLVQGINALPWSVAAIIPTTGYAQGVRFYKSLPSQPDLDSNLGNWASIAVTLDDPNDTVLGDILTNSDFGIAGLTTTTPEPSPWVFLSGMALTGAFAMRRRIRYFASA